jgi:hypothetical protein
MIVYAIKNSTESNEKLVLRYKKMFFQTRTANKLKAEAQEQRKVSRRKIREAAIVRNFYRVANKNNAA